MSFLLFCNTLRRMGLNRLCLSGFSNLYLALIFSMFLGNICSAFTVYKSTSADDTRPPGSETQSRLRDIHTSNYRVKDIFSDYLEQDNPTRDIGGDVILQNFDSDDTDYPDVYVVDGGVTRGVTLQETESPLYSRLIKVILQEDVQSPDVTILRQKRPTPGILGFDNLDFALTTLQDKDMSPPSRGGEVFAPSNRRRLHKPPIPGPSNSRMRLSVGNGNANMGDIQKLVKDMIFKG